MSGRKFKINVAGWDHYKCIDNDYPWAEREETDWDRTQERGSRGGGAVLFLHLDGSFKGICLRIIH